MPLVIVLDATGWVTSFEDAEIVFAEQELVIQTPRCRAVYAPGMWVAYQETTA